MTKKIPELLVSSAYHAAIEAYDKTLPLVHDRQRLNQKINETLVNEWGEVRALADEIVRNAERRLKGLSDNSIPDEPVQVSSPNEQAQVVPDQILRVYHPVEYGRYAAFITNPVRVPVQSRPFMHYSAYRNRWSWRVQVHGHNDFRHINVKNFHSSEVDEFGNWYVLVDSKWRTDQVVFRDYCNK